MKKEEMLLLQSWILILPNLHRLKLYGQEVQRQALQIDIWCHVAVHLWKTDWIWTLTFQLMTNFPQSVSAHLTVTNHPD